MSEMELRVVDGVMQLTGSKSRSQTIRDLFVLGSYKMLLGDEYTDADVFMCLKHRMGRVYGRLKGGENGD